MYDKRGNIMPKKIILDVDTGSDDAVAIILAALHPEIDLAAVCTVKGNQPLYNTTENTKRVLDLIHADVPIYKGCHDALVRDVCPWRIKFENRATAVDENGNEFFIHKALFDLPESDRKVEDMPAPVFYVDYLNHCEEPVTLVCVGPLTNLATALSIDPGITKNIEEIVVMGGADNEANASSSAEFNFFFDPEAAQKVFQCGAKITCMPLDATHKAMVTKDDVKRFEEIGTPAALFAAEMCKIRIEVHTQCQPLELPDACALHDPLCIAYLIDPSVITDTKHYHVDIALDGLSDGATIVDHRYFQDNRNCYFCYNGDRHKFVDIMCDAFRLSR